MIGKILETVRGWAKKILQKDLTSKSDHKIPEKIEKIDFLLAAKEEKDALLSALSEKFFGSSLESDFMNIRDLRISNTYLHVGPSKILASFLGSSSNNLVHISFYDCFRVLTNDSIKALNEKIQSAQLVLHAINSNKTLLANIKSLDLSYNGIEEKFVFEIAQILQKATNLETLSLGFNNLKSGGILYILNSISAKHNSEKLLLEFQNNSATKALADYWQTSHSFAKTITSYRIILDHDFLSFSDLESIERSTNSPNVSFAPLTRVRKLEELIAIVHDLSSLARFYHTNLEKITILTKEFKDLVFSNQDQISIDTIYKFALQLTDPEKFAQFLLLFQSLPQGQGEKMLSQVLAYTDEENPSLMAASIMKRNDHLTTYLKDNNAKIIYYDSSQKAVLSSSPLMIAYSVALEEGDYKIFDDLLVKHLSAEKLTNELLIGIISYLGNNASLDPLYEHLGEISNRNDEFSELFGEFQEKYIEYCNF